MRYQRDEKWWLLTEERCQRCKRFLTEKDLEKWQKWKEQNQFKNPSGFVLEDLSQPACQYCISLEEYSRKHYLDELEGFIGS